jgi:hypothetical protein
MSRRSRRGTVEALPALSQGVQNGLKRLVADNAETVATMLDASSTNSTNEDVVAVLSEKCAQVMKQQQLSASNFLARFFAADLLAEHAVSVLGKSGKGSTATLGDRIAAEWAKNKPLIGAENDETVNDEPEESVVNKKESSTTSTKKKNRKKISSTDNVQGGEDGSARRAAPSKNKGKRKSSVENVKEEESLSDGNEDETMLTARIPKKKKKVVSKS